MMLRRVAVRSVLQTATRPRLLFPNPRLVACALRRRPRFHRRLNHGLLLVESSSRLKNQTKTIRHCCRLLRKKRNCRRCRRPRKMNPIRRCCCYSNTDCPQKRTSLHWMNRRYRGNGQDGRSGYGHGCGPDVEVYVAVDCRLAAVVAAGFHPAVGFRPEEDCYREDACSGQRARIRRYLHAGIRIFHCQYCDRWIPVPLPVRGSYPIDWSAACAAAAILPVAGCGDQNMLTSSCRWCFGSLSIRRLAAFLNRRSAGQNCAESACMDWASLDQPSDWREPREGDPVQLTYKTAWDTCENASFHRTIR